MRFCFHTHCFPDALAPKAMAVLTENAKSCGYFPRTDGTAAGAVKLLKTAGIDGALVCNIATNPRQEHKVNDFAISLAGERGFLFAAGSLHPDSENPEAELDRLAAAGIKGIKVHPDYVGMDITDEKFDRIFSLAEERGFFVVTHTGFDPISPDHPHATATGLLAVVKKHPRLKLIAAHMGGPRQSKAVLETLVGTSVYFDTSLCSIRPDEQETLKTILHEHDEEKILFGTDTPWSDPAAEIAFLERAGLSDRALSRIFFENAANLLAIGH